MNNTKRKELGLWYKPTPMCLAARALRKKQHSIFTPTKIRRAPNPGDEERTRIRTFKHDNIITGKSIVNDYRFVMGVKRRVYKYKPTKEKKYHPWVKGVFKKQFEYTRPSLYNQNTTILVDLGYKYKTSKSVSRRIIRQIERHSLKMGKSYRDGLNCKQRRENKKRYKLNKQAS
jgi:hypothetical protein